MLSLLLTTVKFVQIAQCGNTGAEGEAARLQAGTPRRGSARRPGIAESLQVPSFTKKGAAKDNLVASHLRYFPSTLLVSPQAQSYAIVHNFKSNTNKP